MWKQPNSTVNTWRENLSGAKSIWDSYYAPQTARSDCDIAQCQWTKAVELGGIEGTVPPTFLKTPKCALFES